MTKRALGAAIVAAGLMTQAGAASADPASDKLDLVLKRLEAIEQNNAKLAKENASLRERLNKMDGKRGPTVTAASYTPAQQSGAAQPVSGNASSGNGAYAMASPNAGASTKAGPQRVPLYGILDDNGHYFMERKVGDPLTFYTPGGEITAYGNIDVSLDGTSKDVRTLNLNGATAPVGNFGWMPAVSTNLSYLGVRGFQRVPSISSNFVYQLELGFDVSATPGLKETNSNLTNTVNGAAFNRNTYIGFASPEWGALKIGKTDAPYKNSTAAFNPFAGQIGDYQVIMGNTGGDNRVEFGTRLDHAIWYESPSIGGFQLNALFAPGQNRADNSDNIAAGESDCAGGNTPQSGGNVPVACNDGAFSNAASANLSYTNGPFYATVAYEWHDKVNRSSDITAIFGGTVLPGGNQVTMPTPGQQLLYNQDTAAEDAFKVAALYHLPTKTTIGGIFEMMHRYVPSDLQFQNERTRNGSWVFLSQELTAVDSIHFGWAHAFKANGDPGQHNSATLATPDGLAFVAPNDNQADMVTASYKRKLSSNLTWYAAVAATFNGPSAHYDLGAGGRGVTTDCHDAWAADGGYGGFPHCYTGTTIVGVSTGAQWRF
ncbi:MAG: porin [Xanthobacteraceae bacterium]|nr:porin [Xanthobacteraceae bacterium]